VTTPAGTFLLARCQPHTTFRIDGSGRVWVTYHSKRLDGLGGCSDVVQCTTRGERPLPWEGRLVATPEGRVVGDIDVCLATCVGRFEGRARIELVRNSRGWRLELDDAQVGPGAIELDGSWGLAGPPFDVSAAPST
jgi:hypothetical protein